MYLLFLAHVARAPRVHMVSCIKLFGFELWVRALICQGPRNLAAHLECPQAMVLSVWLQVRTFAEKYFGSWKDASSAAPATLASDGSATAAPGASNRSQVSPQWSAE